MKIPRNCYSFFFYCQYLKSSYHTWMQQHFFIKIRNWIFETLTLFYSYIIPYLAEIVILFVLFLTFPPVLNNKYRKISIFTLTKAFSYQFSASVSPSRIPCHILPPVALCAWSLRFRIDCNHQNQTTRHRRPTGLALQHVADNSTRVQHSLRLANSYGHVRFNLPVDGTRCVRYT